MNCLGRPSRDAGHSLVPAPPHMIKGMMRPLLAGKVLISGEVAIGSDLSQQLNLNPPLFPLKTTSIQAIMRVELNDETTPKTSVLVEFGSIAFCSSERPRMVKTRDPDVGNSSQLYTHPHTREKCGEWLPWAARPRMAHAARTR
jgi:hypothetical protein